MVVKKRKNGRIFPVSPIFCNLTKFFPILPLIFARNTVASVPRLCYDDSIRFCPFKAGSAKF